MNLKDKISLTYSGSWVRIDKRLSDQISFSRSFFGHLFDRWAVLVEWKTIKKSYKLKEWDLIEIESLERYVDGGVLDECAKWDIDVRLESDDYMVIYKPRGVISHPNSVRDLQHPSVVGGVYRYMRSQEAHNGFDLPSMWNFVRAGLVHRLDKETAGLMIIAKTEQWLAYFKGLFHQKSLAASIADKENVPLTKKYQAVCHRTPQGQGFLNSIEGKLPHYIIDDVIPAVPYPVVKKGITKILSILDTDNNEQVLLDIEILTGRTHQIRYHLSKYKLPIVGDYVYGEEDETYMHLRAYRLTFKDIDWKIIDIKI